MRGLPAKTGRPRAYPTSYDLQDKLVGYPSYLMVSGYRNTVERLAAYLGFTLDTLENYTQRTGETLATVPGGDVAVYDEAEDYSRLLAPILASMRADLVESTLTGETRESAGIFLMKQKHYGGYTDRVSSEVDARVTIEMDSETLELSQ